MAVIEAQDRAGGELQRRLGVWDATSVIVGTIIGSGIFLVPADLAGQLGSPTLLLLVWLAGGALSLLGAITFAELGTDRPHAGGQYVFLRDAWGPAWGFLFGWVLLLVIQCGSIAAVAVGFAQYLGLFLALGPGGTKAAAILAIVGLSLVNCASVRWGATVQNLFTVLKLLAIAALVVLGFSSGVGDWDHFSRTIPPADARPLGLAFGLALVGVLWAYDGWNLVSFMAGEVRRPSFTLPVSLLAGVAGVTVVYLATNAAYVYLLGIGGMATAPDERVASAAAATFAGSSGAMWMAAGIVISTFGCLNGMILTGPRVYFAMARDGLFFPALAQVHAETGTPVAALLLQAVWATALALSGTYDQLFTYVIFVAYGFYALSAAAVFRFRREAPPPDPEAEPPYRAWGYPWTPALFVALTGALLLNTLATAPLPSLAGLGITLAGLPVYYFFHRRQPSVG